MSDEPSEPPSHSTGIPLHDLLQLTHDRPTRDGGPVEVHMPVQPGAFGFNGNLHGGAIATMIDLACALAAVNATDVDVQQESLVTADMHVRYLGTPRTSSVTARAEVVKAGRQLIVVNCTVRDGEDRTLASADFSMMRVPLRHPLPAVTPHDPEGPQL